MLRCVSIKACLSFEKNHRCFLQILSFSLIARSSILIDDRLLKLFKSLIFCLFFFYRRTDDGGKPIDANSPEYQLKGRYDNTILKENEAASLKVWPQVIENGGKVVVLWSNIPSPQTGDIIGYYCPFDDKAIHPLDYIQVNSSETWQQGYGHVSVKLYNMRSECGFRYYSNKKLVTVSNKVAFNNGGPLAPLQGHISMTNNPTEMRVMWNSAQGIYSMSDIIIFLSFILNV